MEEETICLQCGNIGFTNAFVYCIRCLNFAVHRYCLPVIPATFDEFVHWVCDDCEVYMQSQLRVHKHDASTSTTRDQLMSINFKGFSGNESEKNDLVVVQIPMDERVRKDGLEQSSDAFTKLDSVEFVDQSANECTHMQLERKIDEHAAEERKMPQPSSSFQGIEEEKVDTDIMRKTKRKNLKTRKRRMWTHIKKKRERKRNVIGAVTEKDEHKLGKRKREQQATKKNRKTLWTHKKRKRNVIEKSDTNRDQHKLGKKSLDQSHKEHVKKPINGCARSARGSTLLSEVRERETKCSEERHERTSKKPSDFDYGPDLDEHPVISCKDPPRKKKKTFELSKLASSKDRIENREQEYKVQRHTCGGYTEQLDVVAAEPVVMPIWRGSFSILNKKYNKLDELMGHISSKACQKVYEVASQFQPRLEFEMFPKSDIWPKSFETSEPSGDHIAIYFFPSKISETVYDNMVNKMMSKELGLKAVVQNAELLIFTSTELPLRYWRFHGKYYLWGVFRGKQNPPSHSHSSKAENPPIKKRGGDGSPISPLSNSASTTGSSIS